jgi:hypothetical protein
MDPLNDVRWKLYAEALRTWLPLVISVCAISLTIYQAYNTRRHTRLSVQPRLDWTVQLGPDGGIAYSLVNDGFGPAILRELNVKLDGEVVGPDGPATCAEIDRRLGREGDAWDTACFDMEGEYVIRAGNGVVVYESQRAAGAPAPAGTPPLGPEDYLRLMPEGGYCSFYEDCWELK